MKKVSLFVLTLTLAGVVLYGMSVVAQQPHQHSQSQSTTSTRSTTEPDVQYKPGPALKAKAASPQPGPSAKQKTKKDTIGEGKALITLRDSNNDFWVEEIDLEGKGQKSEAQMLWDNTDKTLYTYAVKSMMCKSGGNVNSNLLIALYGTGNAEKKPVGSGWWTATLDQGECGMKVEGLYGCKFDQKGNNTACGVAELDPNTHELTIVEARRTE